MVRQNIIVGSKVPHGGQEAEREREEGVTKIYFSQPVPTS
jgi:hypothetical protein